jgi:hypothetical protein
MSLRPTELHDNGVTGAGWSMAGATLEVESEDVFGPVTPDVPIIGCDPACVAGDVTQERDY